MARIVRSRLLRTAGGLLFVCSFAMMQGNVAAAAESKTAHTTTNTQASSSTTKKVSGKHSSKRSKKRRPRGQQAIDSSRAKEIQQALIREHYMEGQASGKWDEKTQSALRKYQADNGWQSKTVPDSRALIKLGLGPSQDGLLNPETAMTSMTGQPATSASPKEPAPAGKGEPR